MIGWLQSLAAREVSHLWHLIGSPTVWAAHFLFCYIGVSVGCAKFGSSAMPEMRMAIVGATIVAVLLVVFFGIVAWLQARLDGEAPPHDEDTVGDRTRLVGTAKLLLAGLSFIAILYVAMPAFVFTDCR